MSLRALIQRVTQASVTVNGERIGEIGSGLMVLLAVQRGDTQALAGRLLDKLLSYRVFSDANDKMNLNVQEVEGGLLIVSQFTLAADTQKGARPSFSSAAAPADAEALYDYFVAKAKARLPNNRSFRITQVAPCECHRGSCPRRTTNHSPSKQRDTCHVRVAGAVLRGPDADVRL